MRTFNRLLLIASLLLVPAHALFAQAVVDPSGHWAGAITVPAFEQKPAMDVAIEIDLTKNGSGALAGTFTQPANGVKGLPLSAVTVDGRSISFQLKASSGGGLFRGTIADAASMSGDFITTDGGYSIPFTLTRMGDAKIAAAPKSAPIGKELEGTWNGTVEVDGKAVRLVLKMANQPDGTAAGTILDLDGSNVDIPIAVTQTASNVTVEVGSVGASYVGVWNAGNQLIGTWTQGAVTLPLTFRKAAK